MKSISLLVSHRAKGAYFNDYLAVAQAELTQLLGGGPIGLRHVGPFDLFDITVDESLLPRLAALSFVHGLFARDGETLTPLPTTAPFRLHEDFVFGAKFRGKTNELLTQLLINVGLQAIGNPQPKSVKLLDPMCGRATTLLWAMRYGIRAVGIEQDPQALGEIRQNVKKWCKVHRQKHQLSEGFVAGGAGRERRGESNGRFIEFAAAESTLRVITGDAADAVRLLSRQRFDLIVSDLPYGVQHFTTRKTRNPLAVLAACAPGWRDSLKQGGAVVLAFNRYQPRREALIELFAEHGLEPLDFAAPHRMSESIVRDVLVLQRPRTD